ncbi:MAG: TetR/AcrR family transcriptional regulator [Thermomicrobiales bacterium]|nr:MAG: TetR/AcrR family transcriptional regulator [Thermomicrobiales bacterium]
MELNATSEFDSSTSIDGSSAVLSARPGRKRDRSRDAAILDAALEVLSEVGYGNLTMDMVAARAHAGKGTLYRRWHSKDELIIDAVGRMKVMRVDLAHPPQTGSLRGDLLALYQPQSMEETERTLSIMAGLAGLLASDASVASEVHAAVVGPWANAHRIIMQRGIERGEIRPDADIETLSLVTPSLAAYRSLVQRLPFDFEFLTSIVDSVLLPALDVRQRPSDDGHARREE